jgi:hypothetical protein
MLTRGLLTVLMIASVGFETGERNQIVMAGLDPQASGTVHA